MKNVLTLLLGLGMLLLATHLQAQDSLSFYFNGVNHWYSNVTRDSLSDTATGYRAFKKFVDTTNPNSGVYVVAYSNGRYDCHAFAWANYTYAYVNSDHDSTKDGPQLYYYAPIGYYRQTTADSAEIAVFGQPGSNPFHSALRLTNSGSSNAFAGEFLKQYPQYVGWYISKWDDGPLVIHQLDSCPYYFVQPSHQITFYRKTTDAPGANNLEYSSADYSIIGRQNIVCSSAGSPFWLSNAVGSDTITSFPAGFKVKWGGSSNITYSPNDSAYPATPSFTGAGGDTAHISATIYFPNGTSGSVGSFKVWEGPPTSITSISTSQYNAGGNGEETITVSSSSAEFYAWPFNTADVVPPSPTSYDTHGASSYWWTCSSGGGPSITFNQDENLIGYRYSAGSFTPPNEYGIITVRAYNACGSTSAFQNILESSSYDIVYRMAPNPASDVLTIDVTPAGAATSPAASATTSATASAALATYTLKIVDLSGTLYYTSTQTGNKFSIPVGNLTPGNYIVILSDGKRASSKNLVVQH